MFIRRGWVSTYPVLPFDNMTDQDAYWAMRIVLSFTEPELRGVVETASYSDQKDTDYVLRTLLERDHLARHWLPKVDALSDFSVRPLDEGSLSPSATSMIDSKTQDPDSNQLLYQGKGASLYIRNENHSEPVDCRGPRHSDRGYRTQRPGWV